MADRGAAVVIEDDADIRGLLATLLTQSGFEVHEAAKGVDGVRAVTEHRPVLVTVDVGLPDIDGFEVTRRVRNVTDAYIVMLTAMSEEIDTLMGLDAGADDYIVKPFRPRELRARVEALLRRPRSAPPAGGAQQPSAMRHSDAVTHSDAATQPEPAPQPARAVPQPASTAPLVDGAGRAATDAVQRPGQPDRTAEERFHYRLDGLCLYPNLYRVTVDQRDIHLTRTQFLLLRTLMVSRRVVRSKAELFRVLREEDPAAGTFVGEADERTVEVHMGNLRRKIGDDVRRPRWIETVRGIGYRLTAAPQSVTAD